MEENNTEKREFIKEKIVKKTGAGKGFRNFVKIVAGAVLFGLIAAGVFVLSRPTAEKIFGTEPESTAAEVVMIPRDEVVESVPETEEETEAETESDAEPETVISDGVVENDVETPDEQQQEEPVGREEIREIVADTMGDYKYTADDFNKIWNTISVLCNSLDSSIVAVKPAAGETEDELFPDLGDHSNEYSGIVIAETYAEAMILTLDDAVASGNGIEVDWSTGESQPGYVKQADPQTGLAIVSVRKSEMSDRVKSHLKPIEPGNSYAITKGALLIAAGCPRGMLHSSDLAWVSYIDKEAHAVDGTSRQIYINNYLESDRGTWMLNVNGELIGWADKNSEGNVVIGISDFKSLIEKMSNLRDCAYIGIVPSSVPGEVAAENADAPEGVYVLEVEKGGPAYEAGILPGDIITSIDEQPVRNASEYAGCIDGLRVGDEVSTIVFREARGQYRELEYIITVGKRNK